jgi:hypothetical protein
MISQKSRNDTAELPNRFAVGAESLSVCRHKAAQLSLSCAAHTSNCRNRNYEKAHGVSWSSIVRDWYRFSVSTRANNLSQDHISKGRAALAAPVLLAKDCGGHAAIAQRATEAGPATCIQRK